MKEGDKVAAFYVTKAGGAPDDGVEVGEDLCYRCKLGNRPVVAVFARTADKELAMLVRNIDKALADDEETTLASFVNLLGDDRKVLTKTGAEFAKDNKLAKVAVVVPEAAENGPENYKLDPEADVTVMIWKQGKIVANHAFEDGKLDKKVVKKIVQASMKVAGDDEDA